MPFVNAASAAAGSTGYIPSALLSGKVRVAQATLTFASDAAGVQNAPIRLPRGARVLYGMTVASATMGASATIAIGTAADAGKYRAAATHTTTAPTLFGVPAALNVALTSEEQIIITTAVAALPASGSMTIMLFYAIES